MSRMLPQPTVDSVELTTLLSALADPVRLELLRTLYRSAEPLECSTLADHVDVTAQTVSHHWRVLREAGLTSTRVEGRKRIIRIRCEDVESRFPGLLEAVLSDHTTKPKKRPVTAS
jgi:DNA-binding transcriptional ArsR family regulator